MVTSQAEVKQFFRAIKDVAGIQVPIAAAQTASEIANVMKEAAIKDYASKRKTTKQPSTIIESFSLQPLQIVGGNSFRAIVFAGGPSAFHAIYVDQGHDYKNKKGHFEGYQFMQAGFDVGVSRSLEILNKHFNNIFVRI